jgi:hypothetical protein
MGKESRKQRPFSGTCIPLSNEIQALDVAKVRLEPTRSFCYPGRFNCAELANSSVNHEKVNGVWFYISNVRIG